MSERVPASRPAPVANDGVWRDTKLIFVTSALVFLVTIALGFLNVFTAGALPRWQLLVHLHSGALGWVTLSFFGATVWLFTAERAVSDAYVERVRWLTRVLIVAFLGLIASFGIAFSQGGTTYYLLAVFAPLAALTIWATAGFFLQQLVRLSEVTTAHLLTASGFLILAIAVTFATIVALGHAGLVAAPDFALTRHVFGILGYEVLVVTGIIEWLVRRDRGRWTRAGGLQVGLGLLLGLWTPLLVLLLLAGFPEEALPILVVVGLLVLLVLFGLVFLGRIGPTALRTTPLTASVDAWVFFATLWFAVGVLSFPIRMALGDPEWWLTVNTHVVFIGITTNLIFGVLSARTHSLREGDTWPQTAAMWLTNGGLVLFVALFVASGSRHGALVMGAGVALGVGWALYSLRETPDSTDTAPNPAGNTTD